MDLAFIKEILQNKGDRKKVLVVGDAILDVYNYGEYVTSVDGGMPMFKIRSKELCLGGALNVASNTRAIGLDSTCISVVGTDGTALIKMLQDRNIDTTGIIHRPDIQTKTITRFLIRQSTTFRIDKVSECAIDVITRKLIENVKESCSNNKYDLVVLCDYRSGMMTIELCQGIISLARSQSIPVIVDPKRGEYDKFMGATVIEPNIDDAKTLCGNYVSLPNDGEMVCKAFTNQLDIDICILTMSKYGIAYYCKNHNARDEEFGVISPQKGVSVIDQNGAGDAVTSAIALGITHEVAIDSTCRLAIACAENIIERNGTVALSLDDVIQEPILTKCLSLFCLEFDEIRAFGGF